jgi:membrane protein required for colicin V production
MSGLTTIDLIVVAIVSLSGLVALWRGLIRETFSIIEWIASAYVALRLAPTFQPMLSGIITPPWLAWIAGFIPTFLIIFVPLSMLTHRFAEFVKQSEISAVDRTLGLIFGVGRGLVIIGLSYIAYASFVPLVDHPPVLTQARLFPLIRNSSTILLSLVPGGGGGRGDSEGGAVSQNERPEEPKTYGAAERSALDRLFEATGRDQDSSR